MNREEQLTFVSELCAGIREDLQRKIIDGRIPEEWDGHELRSLIAYKAVEAAEISLIRKEPRSTRAKNYKNHVRITNL